MTRSLIRMTLKLILTIGALVLVGWLMGDVVVQAEAICEPDGVQPGGAIYRICMPAPGEWNGDLVVYAHGYVDVTEPIAIPEDQLEIEGSLSLPDIVTSLGYAFATTSYRVNGLAVREGLEDLTDLVRIFRETHGAPRRVYLVGASEGGIITALAAERHADVFDGGLAACGPVGDFRSQINYWGDVRVLFDYFFPGLLPGSPVEIPQELLDAWDTVYEPRIRTALWGAPGRMQQLMETARFPAHPTDRGRNVDGLVDVLWYNVFATMDGRAKLGGQPFDNSQRIYRGSADDRRLNRLVARFQAEPSALAAINAHYQTSGALRVPLVTLHTLGDPIVPYWHEPLYRFAIEAQDAQGLHTNIPILLRYGHCQFSVPQVLVAFGVLVRQVTGQDLAHPERALLTPAEREEFRSLAPAFGLNAGIP